MVWYRCISGITVFNSCFCLQLHNKNFSHLYNACSIFIYRPPRWDYRKIMMRLIKMVLSTDIFSKRRKICAWAEENPELPYILNFWPVSSVNKNHLGFVQEGFHACAITVFQIKDNCSWTCFYYSSSKRVTEIVVI